MTINRMCLVIFGVGVQIWTLNTYANVSRCSGFISNIDSFLIFRGDNVRTDDVMMFIIFIGFTKICKSE